MSVPAIVVEDTEMFGIPMWECRSVRYGKVFMWKPTTLGGKHCGEIAVLADFSSVEMADGFEEWVKAAMVALYRTKQEFEAES